MTLRERYKHFKEWQIHAFDWSFDENERHHCVNCDNDFVGNYCPHCSQKSGLGKVTWKSVLQSTAEVWGMGNRSLLYSLWQLIWRPGYFISDYINGKRQVSFPPVKMLVVMGVISVLVDHLFVTPEVIDLNSNLSNINIFFRPAKPFNSKEVKIYLDKKEIFTREYSSLNPPKMENILLDLKKHQLTLESSIMFKVE